MLVPSPPATARPDSPEAVTLVGTRSPLAAVIELHDGRGEPIEDEEAFLREIGLDVEETRSARENPEPVPDFLSWP